MSVTIDDRVKKAPTCLSVYKAGCGEKLFFSLYTSKLLNNRVSHNWAVVLQDLRKIKVRSDSNKI